MQPPSDDELRALLSGDLPTTRREEIEDELDRDPDLRRRLDAISGADRFGADFETSVGDDADHLPPSQQPPTPPDHGEVLDPAADSSGLAGQLGDYEIEELIASGGMGLVYRARDPELKRTVAIKVLAPSLADDPGARDRFLREASAMAAIDHPNVIPIHCIDRSLNGLPFFVMPLIAGPALGDYLEPGRPLATDELLSIARAVAAALCASHAEGLIHRDIKPSNILLRTNPGDAPKVYITDFGLASNAADNDLTAPGMFLGTPGFTSPEQAQGKRADARSDLFSCGAVLYLMATGHPPFPSAEGEADSTTSQLYRIVHEDHVPAIGRNPSLPAWLSELIDRLLEKSPGDRLQDAETLSSCLQEEAAADRRRADGANPWPRVAAGVAAISVATLAVVAWTNRDRDRAAPDGSPPPEVVAVDGSELQMAINAAAPGAVIELTGSEPVRIPPALIPEGKALTIRAAEGASPKLRPLTPDSPMIISQSALTLVGIDLEQPKGDYSEGDAIIIAVGPQLTIKDCRIVRYARPADVRRTTQRGAPLIDCGAGDLDVSNTIILSPGAAVFFHRDDGKRPTRHRFENCVLVGKGIFTADTKLAEEITIHRTTSIGRRIFAAATAPAPEDGHQITATNCAFVAAELSSIPGTDQHSPVPDQIGWEGRENVFSFRGPAPAGFGEWLTGQASTSVETLSANERISPRRTEGLETLRPVDFAIEPGEVDHHERFGPDLSQVGPRGAS